jgi:ribosome biogenesis GTPase
MQHNFYRVLYGINNLFTLLRDDGTVCEARIKGKLLKLEKKEHNALAAGDLVELDDSGRITARAARRNFIRRFNRKSRETQTLCANADLCLCVTALQTPPFHPRFLDRLLIVAEEGGVSPVIVINKADLTADSSEQYFINFYKKLGYPLILCSTVDGRGIDELKALCEGKICALIGASGVGKSTLLNRLTPLAAQKTAVLNKKFNRGNHTTNYAVCIKQEKTGFFIDTPGIRTLTPAIGEGDELAHYYKDFAPYSSACAYANCRHLDEETGCAVKEAVEKGFIEESRYNGYLKLYEEITLKINDPRRYKK